MRTVHELRLAILRVDLARGVFLGGRQSVEHFQVASVGAEIARGRPLDAAQPPVAGDTSVDVLFVVPPGGAHLTKLGAVAGADLAVVVSGFGRPRAQETTVLAQRLAALVRVVTVRAPLALCALPVGLVLAQQAVRAQI